MVENDSRYGFKELVRKLVEVLEGGEGNVELLLGLYHGSKVEWEKYVCVIRETETETETETGYMRYLLSTGNSYSILLIEWPVGAIAPMHYHKGCECWVKLLNGELIERIEGNINETKRLKCGNITHINDEIGQHSMCNEGFEMAITLHVYTKFEMSGLKEGRVDKDYRNEFIK